VELIEKRRENFVREGLEATGLYHSFRLPDGTLLRGSMDMDWQQQRLASFQLPEDLSGKTVLDIGPWDGFYTFEMERRGAKVTAIDYVDLDTFRQLHRVFQSKARYERLDVYELDPERLGTFDIVLCLGALYHFKYPLAALEKICAATREVCIIDTFVVDGETRREGISPPLPYLEFYEREELSGQADNWCGPTVCAVEALARAAGFARANVLRVTDASACVAAHRTWTGLPPEEGPPVEISALCGHAHRGRSFLSNKEEYIVLWCWWTGETPPLDTVFPEVDGFGIAPLTCAPIPSGIVVTLRVPPGLRSGRHEARLKIGRSRWSKAQAFFVDLPVISHSIELASVQDGITWTPGEVSWANGGWVTVWVEGLSPEADAANTTLEIAGVPHFPDAVDAPRGQVNLRLRPLIGAGDHTIIVIHRGTRTAPKTLKVTGNAPPIRGLERLPRETGKSQSTSKSSP
jgi:tRNA (mo5U34)-methyltransferase